jgi:hypothetical protein
MTYYKRNKQAPTKRQDDNGDYDDLGRKSSESQYHYTNKKKRGTF